MAVNKDNGGNQNSPLGETLQQAKQQAATPQGQQYSAPQGQQYAPQQENVQASKITGTGFFNRTNLRPISRRPTSEIVKRYVETINEGINITNANASLDKGAFKFNVAMFDRMAPLSVITVTASTVHAGRRYIGAFNLFLEASSEELPPTKYSQGDKHFIIPNTTNTLIEENLHKRIAKELITVAGHFSSETFVLMAGDLVIHREVDPSDEQRLREITAIAINAVWKRLDDETIKSDIPLTGSDLRVVGSNALEGVSRVDVNLSFSSTDINSPQAENVCGLPVRSDIRVSTGVVNKETNFESRIDLCEADAYVDLIYTKPQLQQGGYIPTQCYIPNLVITRLAPAIDANSLEVQLLALLQASVVLENKNWVTAFAPKHGVKGVDMKDIGAIGLEANLTGLPDYTPVKVDTKSKNFTPESLMQMVGVAFLDGVIVSMDVEPGSDEWWLQKTFLQASVKNSDGVEAIIKAADNLTNGAFSNVFKSLSQSNGGYLDICSYATKIHLGYYTDSNGMLRDIRDFDYLAMMNLLGENNRPTFERWGMGFTNSECKPEPEILEERLRILTGLNGNIFKIKGYGYRINFNPLFFQALLTAASQSGISLIPNNIHQYYTPAPSRIYQGVNEMMYRNTNSPILHYGNTYGNVGQRLSPNAFNDMFTTEKMQNR